jgi:DNA-binding transcriptional LysR family regulator
VLLTEAGRELLKYSEAYLDSLENLFENVQSQTSLFKGKVRYAMPDSCLFTPHFPLLLEKRQKEFPNVDLAVSICDSEEVLRLISKGEIDFGFVTKPVLDKSISAKEFAREEYVLVSHLKTEIALKTPMELMDIHFISYPGMDVLFDHWFASEFPRAKKIHLQDVKIVGEINSLRGAVTMVESGLGVAIFQKQCVSAQIERKTIFAYSGKADCPENPIYLVQPREHKQPARVQAVIDAFWEMKRG